MLELGVQTRNVVVDESPEVGFELLNKTGFQCADFSLNSYLKNSELYRGKRNQFFDQTVRELQDYFLPHKLAAQKNKIRIHQMHMPYPNYVPGESKELNDYLWNVVAPKSMEICKFLDSKYIVVHGFKLARHLGSEEAEWEKTAAFLEFLAPMAKEMELTICVENIYTGIGNHIIEGPCCDAKKAAYRIDKMNDKYGAQVLGFCFDTGHANLVGLEFEPFLETLGDRLKVLHIHDNDGSADLHQIPFTFSKNRENHSSTDWNGFLRGLKNIHFDKVLNFETAPVLDAFPKGMKENALRFIAEIGHYFSAEIEEDGLSNHENLFTQIR